MKRYLRGFNLICSDAGNGTPKTYFNYNAHGDVTQLVDESGSVTRNYKYDSFGNQLNLDNSDTNPFRYAGEYYDNELEIFKTFILYTLIFFYRGSG